MRRVDKTNGTKNPVGHDRRFRLPRIPLPTNASCRAMLFIARVHTSRESAAFGGALIAVAAAFDGQSQIAHAVELTAAARPDNTSADVF